MRSWDVQRREEHRIYVLAAVGGLQTKDRIDETIIYMIISQDLRSALRLKVGLSNIHCEL